MLSRNATVVEDYVAVLSAPDDICSVAVEAKLADPPIGLGDG
jgi:hypothetical protein